VPTSLRRKLFSSLAAPTGLLLAIAGAVAYGTAKGMVADAYDHNLLNLAHAIATHVHPAPDGLTLTLSSEVEAVLRSDTRDRIYFRVRDAQGRLLGGDASLPLLDDNDALSALPVPYSQLGREPAPAPVPRVPSSRPLFRDLMHEAQPIRALRLYRDLPGGGFYVTVAETLVKRDEAMDRLLIGFASAAGLLLLAASIAVEFGIPSGLAPLERLEDSLRKRSGADLSPIEPADAPDEVREVVRALNGLLERQRTASERQREFLQDAAHQLRTPLGGLADAARTARIAAARRHRTHTPAPIGRARDPARQPAAHARACRGRRSPDRGQQRGRPRRTDRPDGRGLGRPR